MEAAERRRDPPAGADQGHAGKKSAEQEEEKCKFENNAELWSFVWCRGCFAPAVLLLISSTIKIPASFTFPSPNQSFFCVPFLQMYLSAKQREEEQRALLARQAHLEEVLRQAREMEAKAESHSITDQEMVDTIFNFLPPLMNGPEGPAGPEVGSLQSFAHSEFKVSRFMFPFVVRILKREG